MGIVKLIVIVFWSHCILSTASLNAGPNMPNTATDSGSTVVFVDSSDTRPIGIGLELFYHANGKFLNMKGRTLTPKALSQAISEKLSLEKATETSVCLNVESNTRAEDLFACIKLIQASVAPPAKVTIYISIFSKRSGN